MLDIISDGVTLDGIVLRVIAQETITGTTPVAQSAGDSLILSAKVESGQVRVDVDDMLPRISLEIMHIRNC